MYERLRRKVEARIQARRGPPWYQSFADFFKLMAKEQIIPATASNYMVLAPFLSLTALLIATLIIPFGLTQPPVSFVGDIIVLIYLLTIPSVALVLAGS
ncbi:MAG: NADH-quinone oxidoreductase subunit H, partial [Candidatus Bathyarchaeota archaeon]|nr:NADH-quinone oxidoreductase subunit H [Candidatus Bathyarchaeota archaeon]